MNSDISDLKNLFTQVQQCPRKYDIVQTRLRKRVKELKCLYGFAELIEKKKNQLTEIYQGLIEIIPPAWQYPEITCARLSISEEIFTSENFKTTRWRQAESIIVDDEPIGVLEVFYLKEMPSMHEGPFLEEEKFLIKNLCEHLGRVIQRCNTCSELKKSEKLLQIQKNTLEQKNTALKEILFQFELEKKKMETNIQSNIDNLILPTLEKLKLYDENNLHIEILTQALRELTSSFGSTIKSKYTNLSPREIEICHLLKNGLSSKEIAHVLSISPETINKHRFHIRKKLEIQGNKKNLVSFLQSIS